MTGPYSRYGSHSIEMARTSSPGAGMNYPLNLRWCFRCNSNVSSEGGKMRGALFECAGCREKKKGQA